MLLEDFTESSSKEIPETAVLKLVKGLCYKKHSSHQAVDTIWEIYILRQYRMAVITSSVSMILQVCQFISSQVKQEQWLSYWKINADPQTVRSTAWAT